MHDILTITPITSVLWRPTLLTPPRVSFWSLQISARLLWSPRLNNKAYSNGNMASIPFTSPNAPAETPEKPGTADSSETTQNVQYDESVKLRLSKKQEEGKVKLWKKFREGQKRHVNSPVIRNHSILSPLKTLLLSFVWYLANMSNAVTGGLHQQAFHFLPQH